jgi:hypothetical protein
MIGRRMQIWCLLSCVGCTITIAGDSCAARVPKRTLEGSTLNSSFHEPTENITICCDACNADPQCEGWVINKNTKYCNLKANITGHKSNDKIKSSGYKDAPTPAPTPPPSPKVPTPAPPPTPYPKQTYKFVATWRGEHPKEDKSHLGNVVGDCTASLIAPLWIITAGHCAERVLKHEKVNVKINFHGAEVERSVTKCIHADGDQVILSIPSDLYPLIYPSVYFL